jgi:hypothetical protein
MREVRQQIAETEQTSSVSANLNDFQSREALWARRRRAEYLEAACNLIAARLGKEAVSA